MLPQYTEGDERVPGWSEISEVAQVAEDIGFDSLWLVDHFLYQLEGNEPPLGVWECWSLLSALAACTRTVELGTLVVGMGFRNPALLAKMADTVDEISNGRLVLGLGAGYHELEYRAFGYPYDHRYSRFAEAIQIVHGLLKTGRIDLEGKYYQVRECELRPRGPRPEGPPIMIGSCGHKMLRLTARYADSWNAFWHHIRNSSRGVAQLREKVDEACDEVGRDRATLERTVAVLVAAASADPWWTQVPFADDRETLKPLFGTPEHIADELRAYANEGISSVQIHLEPITCKIVETFAHVLEEFDSQ